MTKQVEVIKKWKSELENKIIAYEKALNDFDDELYENEVKLLVISNFSIDITSEMDVEYYRNHIRNPLKNNVDDIKEKKEKFIKSKWSEITTTKGIITKLDEKLIKWEEEATKEIQFK